LHFILNIAQADPRSVHRGLKLLCFVEAAACRFARTTLTRFLAILPRERTSSFSALF
jgi:hypothetical protein